MFFFCCSKELLYFKPKATINEQLLLEQAFLSNYLNQLQSADPPGSAFTAQIQKEVFNGMFIEDPLIASDLVAALVRQSDEASKNKTKKEQSELSMNILSRFLEV